MTFPSRGTHLFFLVALLFVVSLSPARGEGTAAPKTTTQTAADPDIAKAEADITASPESAPSRARLGFLVMEKGLLDDADRRFDEALKLNPRSFEAKTGKGAVLARRGKLKEAEAALREALVLNPNPVRTHYELGLVLEKEGDFAGAAAEFKEGIRKHEQGRM